ncbi:MAG: type II toxin-antitoxin system RelE family toxin [Promethearchaeota archaeon]
MFQVFLTDSALRELKKLPHLISKRIYNKIYELVENPFKISGIKKLVGKPYYRLRIGDYRAIFTLNKKNSFVFILKIAQRKNIYKK